MRKMYIVLILALMMVLSVAAAVPAMAAPTSTSRGIDIGFQYAPAVGGGVAVGVPIGRDFAFVSRVGSVINLDAGTAVGLQLGLRYYFNNDGSIRLFSVLYAGGTADFLPAGTTTFTFVGTLGAGLQYTTTGGAFASVEIDTNWVDRGTVPGYGLAFAIGKQF